MGNALRIAPVRIERVQIEDGFWQPGQSICRWRDGARYCEFMPPHWVPPWYQDRDVNQVARNDLVSTCMRAKGYAR